MLNMRKYIQIEKSFFIILIIIFIGMNFKLYSQDTYRVFFKDKGERFKSDNKIKSEIFEILNERCLKRRAKVLPVNSLFSIDDAPVFKPYLQELSNTGAEILVQLRWKNYCVVRADSSSIENIKSLEFVKSTQSTGSKLETSSLEIFGIQNKQVSSKISNDNTVTDSKFHYGNAFRQIEMLGIDKLQALGFTGDGVLIGFLDSGFRWRQHKSLRNAKVMGEYDFINADSLTYNDSTDNAYQDHHGTLVFSTVAGFSNGDLIGTAPNAKFLLAKTECLKFEKRIEEDFFAAGIEWMESQGVDVVNASLGYSKFDSTNASYKNEDFNGTATICDQAVNTAFEHGMVIINAVGNNGGDSLTLNTPADAIGAFSVGSVDSNGVDVSPFSSKGPNAIGMIKPEFMAFGNKPVCASPENSEVFVAAKGTSIASPLLAGSIGLILSIYPQITPIEIEILLKSVSSCRIIPDNKHGWGVPNIFEAVRDYGIAISPIISYRVNNFQRIVVNLLSKQNIIKHKLFIKFQSKSYFTEFELTPSGIEYQYYTDIPLENFMNKSGFAYFIAESATFTSRIPFQPDSLNIINPYLTIIPQGIDTEMLPRTILSTTSSYIYPTIIKNDDSNLKLNIFSNKTGNFEIKIFDYLGTNIENFKKNTEKEGYNEFDLNVSNYASGAYFVIIIKPDAKEILKFLITK
jgi:hypothetical protein